MNNRAYLKRLLAVLLLLQGVSLVVLFGSYSINALLTGRTPELAEQMLLANSVLGIFSIIIAVLLLAKKYRAVKAATIIAIVVGAVVLLWFMFKGIGTPEYVFAPHSFIVGLTCIMLQVMALLFVRGDIIIKKTESGSVEYIQTKEQTYHKESALVQAPILTYGIVSHIVFGFMCLFFTIFALLGLLSHPLETSTLAAPLAADFFIRCLQVFAPFWTGIPILIPNFFLWQKKFGAAAILIVVCGVIAFVPALMEISFFTLIVGLGAICWAYLIINYVLTLQTDKKAGKDEDEDAEEESDKKVDEKVEAADKVEAAAEKKD